MADDARVAVLTRQIASHAQTKQLEAARGAYDTIIAEGLAPSRYTYSALINAHVTSGDLAGAAAVLAQMEQAGFAADELTGGKMTIDRDVYLRAANNKDIKEAMLKADVAAALEASSDAKAEMKDAEPVKVDALGNERASYLSLVGATEYVEGDEKNPFL